MLLDCIMIHSFFLYFAFHIFFCLCGCHAIPDGYIQQGTDMLRRCRHWTRYCIFAVRCATTGPPNTHLCRRCRKRYWQCVHIHMVMDAGASVPTYRHLSALCLIRMRPSSTTNACVHTLQWDSSQTASATCVPSRYQHNSCREVNATAVGLELNIFHKFGGCSAQHYWRIFYLGKISVLPIWQ